MNPVAINDIFKGFYTNLYKAETDFDEPICKQYLDKLELPRISQIDKESLEAPLSLEELHVSLKSLQKCKSLGLQPQIRKSWDSMENANKKRK